MKAASEVSPGCLPACASQYCITIARLAAPQPSSVCFTKGTSSQTAGSAASRVAHRHTVTATTFVNRFTARLVDCDDDKDERCDRDQDDQKIAIIETASGEIVLCFVGARCQLRQVGIRQRRNGGLHLGGI